MIIVERHITYGPGGFDARRPAGGAIEEKSVEVEHAPDPVAGEIAVLHAKVNALMRVPEVAASVDLAAIEAATRAQLADLVRAKEETP